MDSYVAPQTPPLFNSTCSCPVTQKVISMIKPSHQFPEHKYVLMGWNGESHEGSVQPSTLLRIVHPVDEFFLHFLGAFFLPSILSRQASLCFAYEPRSEGMDESTEFACFCGFVVFCLSGQMIMYVDRARAICKPEASRPSRFESQKALADLLSL